MFTLGFLFQYCSSLMNPCSNCKQNQHCKSYAANTEIEEWLPIRAVHHLDRFITQRHPLQNAESGEDSHRDPESVLSDQWPLLLRLASNHSNENGY